MALREKIKPAWNNSARGISDGLAPTMRHKHDEDVFENRYKISVRFDERQETTFEVEMGKTFSHRFLPNCEESAKISTLFSDGPLDLGG